VKSPETSPNNHYLGQSTNYNPTCNIPAGAKLVKTIVRKLDGKTGGVINEEEILGDYDHEEYSRQHYGIGSCSMEGYNEGHVVRRIVDSHRGEKGVRRVVAGAHRDTMRDGEIEGRIHGEGLKESTIDIKELEEMCNSPIKFTGKGLKLPY